MRILALLSTIAILPGCSTIAAFVGDGAVLTEAPTTLRSSYRLVKSGPPNGAQVSLFSISGGLGGLHVSDYAGLGAELYILPGSYTIAYACAGASIFSYENKATIRISRVRNQYFHCDDAGALKISAWSRQP